MLVGWLPAAANGRLGAPVTDVAGGARHNREAPFRIVVMIAGENATGVVPPSCFFTSALRVLRADASERVLLLVEPGTRAMSVAREIQSTLDEWVSLQKPRPSLRDKRQPSPAKQGLPAATAAAVAAATASVTAAATLYTQWESMSVAEIREYAASGDDAQLLHQLMRACIRVVWGDTSGPMPQELKRARRNPYEVVWSWCASQRKLHHGVTDADDALPLAPRCDEWLPHTVANFEVQARMRTPRHDASDTLPNTNATNSKRAASSSHSCVRHVLVRSIWSKSRWHDVTALPSSHIAQQQTALQRGEWAHENVCLGYSRAFPVRGSSRWNVLAQAHPTTRQLLWPLPWQDLYSEYVPGYLRLDSDTADHFLTYMVNMTANPTLSQCQWHNVSAAFVTELTMDNLYHALIHAVPIREFFQRLLLGNAGSKDIHLIPHYIQYWPRNFEQSVGWQLLMRSLGVSASGWPAVAARAQTLTQPEQCNCYRHMYGGHGAFMPPPYMRPMQRVVDFRAALAASARPPRVRTTILFQLRHNGVRQIVNEDEVVAGVKADPVLGDRVRFVVMESLPVMEQYAAISSATSLAGMHGMGLAWTMLLGSAAGTRSSCLEITGMWAKFNRLDYYSLSRANNVRYLRLSQPNAPECLSCKRCSYRTCGNITANVSQMVDKLKHMADGR